MEPTIEKEAVTQATNALATTTPAFEASGEPIQEVKSPLQIQSEQIGQNWIKQVNELVTQLVTTDNKEGLEKSPEYAALMALAYRLSTDWNNQAAIIEQEGFDPQIATNMLFSKLSVSTLNTWEGFIYENVIRNCNALFGNTKLTQQAEVFKFFATQNCYEQTRRAHPDANELIIKTIAMPELYKKQLALKYGVKLATVWNVAWPIVKQYVDIGALISILVGKPIPQPKKKAVAA
ncbi:MAG: hypothetical protein Fur003_5080 [Candidatus Dojkabacteria bacterium]